jgi:hypothetical protein
MKSILSFLLLIIFANQLFANSSGEKELISYGVEITAGSGVATELLVNGVPVANKATGAEGVQSLAVHGEVIPGANIIDVLVGTEIINPKDKSITLIQKLPEDFYLSIKLQKDLVRDLGDRYETEIEEVDSIDWKPGAIPANGLPLPYRLTLKFNAPVNLSSPIWLKATPLAIENVKIAVVARLKEMANFLQSGEITTYTDLLRYRYEDAARAYPLGGDAARLRQQDERELRYLINLPGFHLLPIDEDALECNVYAAGRLIECSTPGSKAAIIGYAEGIDKPIMFPMKFSMIQNRLQVVR